jgi:hypothetical protein
MSPIDEIDEDVQAAIAGELLLLERSVQRSPEALGLLLHQDFFAFDPYGRRLDRQRAMDAFASHGALPGLEGVARVSELEGMRISRDVVLLRYISRDMDQRCNRSSVWRMTRNGWRLYFHQGTLIPS